MKNLKFYIAVAMLATVMTSCKDEKKERAEVAVNNYTVYVDSVSRITAADAAGRWDEIEAAANERKAEAENALADLKDRAEYEQRIASSNEKYVVYRQTVVVEKEKAAAPPVDDASDYKTTLRTSLFGSGVVIGDDMSFSWVNKDNILKTYDRFVQTVKDNKDEYSREDWDEIKLLYEALDTRKNTVEKEGLSDEDNNKIAGLKMQFAPMYRLNRMGAKSAENKYAKE